MLLCLPRSRRSRQPQSSSIVTRGRRETQSPDAERAATLADAIAESLPAAVNDISGEPTVGEGASDVQICLLELGIISSLCGPLQDADDWLD